LILEVDRSVSESYGEQEGTAYNGRFERTGTTHGFCPTSWATWNTPCFAAATSAAPNLGDACCCRSSSVIARGTFPSSSGVMLPFANPPLDRLLEKEGYRYAIRIKSNAVLEREIHLGNSG